jgi:hypothetical protein
MTHTHTHTHMAHTQILAVTCHDTTASNPSAQNFVIIPAHAVIVSLTLDGLTVKQVTTTVQQQLVAAVADSIGVPRLSVQFVSVSNGRRRLLALVVTCRVLAVDAQQVAALQEKIAKADLQVCVCVIVLSCSCASLVCV